MSAPEVTSYRFGPFRLDTRERLLYCQGQPVPLTPKAAGTLIVLVTRHGRLVTKDDILREVWPDVVVEENNLAQHISMLRRTLALNVGDVPLIETVPKRGYRFVAPVIEDGAPSAVAAPAGVPLAAPVPAAAPFFTSDPPPASRHAGRLWAVSAVAIVVSIGLGWFLGLGRPDPVSRSAPPSPGPRQRVAVLPFVHLGPAQTEYLADGTVEELTSRLATIGGLGVISTTSTREYDRTGKTIRRIGADLGASYIIEGSVRRDDAGGDVRIIPRMIRVADDVTVWTQQYQVTLSGIERAHADMARRIGEALHADAGGDGAGTRGETVRRPAGVSRLSERRIRLPAKPVGHGPSGAGAA